MPRAAKPHVVAPDLDHDHDSGFAAASERAARALDAIPPDLIGHPLLADPNDTREIRVGTASWTDPTITKGGVFYPRGVSSSEDRLRYYASQFSTVEVDSTYYSLPERAIAALWAERTPGDFVFHVKAHALMTGQPTEVARLPEPILHYPVARLEDAIHRIDQCSTLGDEKLAASDRKISALSGLAHGAGTFLRVYLLKLGFLDGAAGFMLAVANAEGAYYRYQKAWLARQRRG